MDDAYKKDLYEGRDAKAQQLEELWEAIRDLKRAAQQLSLSDNQPEKKQPWGEWEVMAWNAEKRIHRLIFPPKSAAQSFKELGYFFGGFLLFILAIVGLAELDKNWPTFHYWFHALGNGLLNLIN